MSDGDFDKLFGKYEPEPPNENDLVTDNRGTYGVAPRNSTLRRQLSDMNRREDSLPFKSWPDEGGQALFSVDKMFNVLKYLKESGHDQVLVRVENNHPVIMQARHPNGGDPSLTFAMVAPRLADGKIPTPTTDEWFGHDDVVFERWDEFIEPDDESDTCDVVKQDGEVCGRDRPCPYHDKRGDQ